MDIVEKPSNIDLDKILEELRSLPVYHDRYDHNAQICLQGVKGNDDPHLGCTATHIQHMKFKISGHQTRDFTIPLCDIPYINKFMSDHNMYYTRVMHLSPKRCYGHHQDTKKRIHIPLVTNEDAWLIVNKQVHHIPANGNYYIVDTTQMHTAINTSSLERLHIVGNINDTEN